jgi:hypothetical protein
MGRLCHLNKEDELRGEHIRDQDVPPLAPNREVPVKVRRERERLGEARKKEGKRECDGSGHGGE